MKHFFVTVFGTIVGLLIGAALVVALAGYLLFMTVERAVTDAEERAALPRENIVLQLDLRAPRLDQPSRAPAFFAAPLSTVEMVQALEHAQSDPRIDGLLIRANPNFLPPAQAEELRSAIGALKAAGKFVVVHAQGFEGGGMSNYFAVSNADAVWLQGASSFSASGFVSETLFYGGLIERFGAQADYVQFREYKNAANIYTETGYTDAHREATLSLLGSLYEQSIEGIARDRGRDAASMRTLIEAGPYTADEAHKAGLVDEIGQYENARSAVLQRAGESASLVDLERYFRSLPDPRIGEDGFIALIEGQGAVVTGFGVGGFGAEDMIGSDRIAAALDTAARDRRVKAIILRLDTSGGAPVASDQILEAMRRAREAGKPVVVSMGDVAASAGYYIAAGADRIIANPSTVTGSIGVLAGKVVIDGALNEVGLNIEPLSVGGEYALAFSSAVAWTPDQRASFSRLVEAAYDDFIAAVAEGRGMSTEAVEEIARGRVWTGAQALEIALVDELGGFTDAVAAARELGGSDTLVVRRYPRAPSAFDIARAMFGFSAEAARAVRVLAALEEVPEVRAALEARRAAGEPIRLETPEAEALRRD